MADALGLERPGTKGNYKSPLHDDKTPSLSVTPDGQSFKDWSCEGDEHASGSIIDLVMHTENLLDVKEAVKRLHQLFDIPPDPQPSRDGTQSLPRKSTAEFIADKCFTNTLPAKEYLINERCLPEALVDRAIMARSVGYNDWTSDKVSAGEPLHGGPAVAFIVRSLNPGKVMAVDTRYLDPALNGGVKTQCLGEKYGHPWFMDRRSIERAKTVYIVESPINALTVEAAGIPKSAALATRGTGNVENIDWRFLVGKQVIICMDNDEPNEKGHCPGQAAAWLIHEQLTALNISALMVDQLMWTDFGWNDLNDVIKDKGPDEVRKQLRKLETWIIPGLPGKGDPAIRQALETRGKLGKARVFLPVHDFTLYWRYRAKEDFVSYVKDSQEDEDSGEVKKSFSDVCGFRIAAISRVRIAGVTATMTGEPDTASHTVFAVSVQTPRHGPELQRRVFEDERLHNIDQWKKFGPVFAPSPFLRMVNILERGAHLGSRDVVNFVGLAWRNGKPVVNEGPDCYFSNPDQQCPYHNLQFPSGPTSSAKPVIESYHDTFKKNAALQLLTWSLGGHLKAFLGFWPHMTLQADKGSGKSTLIKRLERTIGFTMLSGQSIQTEFRLLTSISSTSHPVGWEELSARDQRIIDKAVNMLQENYQYTVTKRGAEMTSYLLTAPVLLAGEDVPVESLTGKIMRTDLNHGKGPEMPDDLPRFPVLQWLQWLATLKKPQVKELYKKVLDFTLGKCRAPSDDNGAVRMAGNYAAMITAWRLLCEFSGVHRDYGNFIHDALEAMNTHIAETAADREPWVWITELAISEIDCHRYAYPYKFEEVEAPGVEVRHQAVLWIRTSHIMNHIAHTPALKDKWNALPVKSDRVYKRQLLQAGVILTDQTGAVITKECTVGNKRVSNMVGLDLEALAEFGLYASPPQDNGPAAGYGP